MYIIHTAAFVNCHFCTVIMHKQHRHFYNSSLVNFWARFALYLYTFIIRQLFQTRHIFLLILYIRYINHDRCTWLITSNKRSHKILIHYLWNNIKVPSSKYGQWKSGFVLMVFCNWFINNECPAIRCQILQ